MRELSHDRIRSWGVISRIAPSTVTCARVAAGLSRRAAQEVSTNPEDEEAQAALARAELRLEVAAEA